MKNFEPNANMELWNTEMTAANVLNVIVMNHATTLNVLYLEQNAQLKLNVNLMVLVFDTGESILIQLAAMKQERSSFYGIK